MTGDQQVEVEVTQITSAQVRYIKLGSGGAWAPYSFVSGIIPFGYAQIPHDPARQVTGKR